MEKQDFVAAAEQTWPNFPEEMPLSEQIRIVDEVLRTEAAQVYIREEVEMWSRQGERR